MGKEEGEHFFPQIDWTFTFEAAGSYNTEELVFVPAFHTINIENKSDNNEKLFCLKSGGSDRLVSQKK